jgi:glycosyltransferase involved in cell wall biosynthesis
MTAQPAPVAPAPLRLPVCLLVDTIGWYAGTERQVAETAARLDPERFEVHVCCLEASPQLDALKSVCKVAVFPAQSFNSLHGIQQALRLRQYLDEQRIRIVHAYMNKTALFAVFSSLLSHRIVVTSRLNTGYWYTPGLRLRFQLLNLATTHIMANSREAKRIAVAMEKIAESRISVVYQGVDMNVFRPGAGDPSICEELGIPPGARVVGIVANLRPVKDHVLFLRAAALVAQKIPDAVFLLVGSGELYEELKQLAQELGIAERVFFTQGKGKVVDYLSRMCIGCLTSHSEGFSNSIMEYMAAGLPAVATAVGGNLEAIVDGKTGYLVHERTSEAFAKPLIDLLENEGLRKQMGELGYVRCAENFEIGKTIRSLEDFYLSLAASRR